MVPPIDPCDFATPGPCGVNPAFSYTRYPCDYDDSRPSVDTRGLPVIVDLQTPIIAEVANRNREATLAIEGTLGLAPAGTYNTVRDRLDALDYTLCDIWNAITGGGSPVNVLYEGSTVVTGVHALNFIGGVTVTNAGSHQANITITGTGGDGYEPIHEALTVAAPGQTNFILSYIPWDGLVLVFIDGLKQEMGDYTVTGNQLTWNGETLIVTDVVEVLYFRLGAGGGGGGGGGNTIMYQEVFYPIPGQTIFVVSNIPINSEATEMFIDGISMTYGVDYTVAGSTITYNNYPVLDGTEVVVIKYFEDLSVSPVDTYTVRVSVTDTSPAFLDAKVSVGNGLDSTILNSPGNEILQLSHVQTVGSSALLAGTNNNVNPTGWAGTFTARWSSPGAADVTGIAALTADDMVMKRMHNVGVFDITFKNEDVGSIAANRIITPTGTDLILPANYSIDLFYDVTTGRWRIGGIGGGATVDELIRINVTDTTAEYLEDKLLYGNGIDGYVMDKGGGNLAMFIYQQVPSDSVSINAADTTPAYLEDKLLYGNGIDGYVMDKGGGDLAMFLYQQVPSESVSINATDTTPEYLEDKLLYGGGIDGYVMDKGGGNLAMFLSQQVPSEFVSVNASDSTPAYLQNKITAGYGIVSVPISLGGGNLSLLIATYAVVCNYTLAGGDNDNVPLTCWESGNAHRLDSLAAATITGIDASLLTYLTVRVKKLYNVGSFSITLKHEDVGSLAINRLIIPGAVDFVMAPNDVVDIFYDITSARWRIG